MKKILFVLLITAATFCASAQTTPYLSTGASLSSQVLTEGVELGCFDALNSYSVTVESYEVSGKRQWYAGPKYYRKTFSVGKNSGFYLSGALKVHLSDNTDIVFEPGAALITSLSKRTSIQVSVSTPIYENTVLFKPIGLSGGISLNWSLK